MGRRNKLQKFAEILSFPNVYENYNVKQPQLSGVDGEPVELRGQWRSGHFHNDHPVTLELACGGGEYTLGLGRRYPQRNFIGVDVKGARIWKGARIALSEGLHNVAFLRTRIEVIDHFFGQGEVDEIWITFPDPFMREGKANRRLTSPRFLDTYRRFLRPDGLIHLKTDEPNLYQYTLETIAADPRCTLLYHDDDIYARPLPMQELELKTKYEMMHLAAGKTIKYVRFRCH